MDEIVKSLLDTVLPVLGTALASLITMLVWKAQKWLDARIHDARFHCATHKIATLTTNAVNEAEQTHVRHLRKTDSWDTDRALEIRDGVVEVVKRHLGSRGVKELTGCLGIKEPAIEGMIRTHIEAAVHKNRNAA